MPPFKTQGEGGAEFRCLAYVPIKFRQQRSHIPAELGIYVCSHEAFTRFSRHCFTADHARLAYTRGDDQCDTLPFIVLTALLEAGIHPSTWKLFPRMAIPTEANGRDYEEARREICRILHHFRYREMVARLTGDPVHAALVTPAAPTTRLAWGDCPEEDAEIEHEIATPG